MYQRPNPHSCLEILALGKPTTAAFGPDWPLAPGQVRRGASNRFDLLHVARGRWLAPAPTDALQAHGRQLIADGKAVLFDVEGKWRPAVVPKTHAEAVLLRDIDVELTLGGRECAAVTLFDCPAIFARNESHYHFWVQASYWSNWPESLLGASGALAELVLENLEES